MSKLNIGLSGKKKPFTLDLDAALQKFAILGISGSGKSCTASVMAEEMCKNGLPWIALDPVSVWWGLRALKDGSPSGYPVVVFGGDHADLPLEKGSGAKIAEALINENVFAVIDLSLESKRFWHTWVTDFALTLMQLNPKVQRHIFVEEAPEFVPQRTKVDLTARCKEALERLIRLGRNRGYGYTLISQRPATVDKDCLSQTENLFVLRTVGAHDRKALNEWLNFHNKEDNGFLDDIQSLENGTGYFWSPHWMKNFVKVKVRERETFHPGETRKVGKAQKAVDLCDVGEFVAKLRSKLTKTQIVVPAPITSSNTAITTTTAGGNAGEQVVKVVANDTSTISIGRDPVPFKYVMAEPIRTAQKEKEEALQKEIDNLRRRLVEADGRAKEATRRLESVRKVLQPQYDAMRALFGELGPSNGHPETDLSIYDPWLQKAGGGKRCRMLEVVIERKELTRAQLSTLSGTSISSSGFKNSLSWMKVNQLVDVDGDVIRLRVV